MKIEIDKKTGFIIIGVFVVLGILTLAIPTDDESDGDKSKWEQVDSLDQEDKSEAEGKAPYESNVVKTGQGQETKEEETDPYQELEELIGLESVKQEVNSLANLVKIQKEREAKGLKVAKISYHLVFTGSPGTGKTTVARIVARIYKDLGILKKGHLVETDRSGLIGQYVGQTAPRVNAMCDSALNGVLFIDEAYALTQGGNSDYGAEAVATLLKRMEDDRDKLVVIVAGYTDEMQQFINSNPGLQSRFNRYINFPDYSAEELYQIFRMYTKKNQYTITKQAATYLYEQLKTAVANKDRNFGNARYVRNVFEKSIQCQANRLSTMKNPTSKDLMEITEADIKAAM